MTCQILALLVNTLARDKKYPVLNRDNLRIRIKIQLSEKKKTFSGFFAAFFKSRLNFEDFEKKGDKLVTGKEIGFEKVYLLDMPNLGTPCKHIGWR